MGVLVCMPDGSVACNAVAGTPSAETCNNIDDNCDGLIDNGLPTTIYYFDNDQDGFGNPNIAGVASCSPIAGMVTNQDDCNDNNFLVKPSGVEICNGIDDDCDLLLDDNDLSTTGQPLWYADAI